MSYFVLIQTKDCFDVSEYFKGCLPSCTSKYMINCMYVVVGGCNVSDIALGVARAILNGYHIERFWILEIETIDVKEFDLSTRTPQVRRYPDILLERDVVRALCLSKRCRNSLGGIINELVRLGVKKLRIDIEGDVYMLTILMPKPVEERKGIVSYLRVKQIESCIQEPQKCAIEELKVSGKCVEIVLL